MKIFEDNEYLVVNLEGKVNSNNAAEIQSEIQNILKEHEDLKLIFDVENLSYISSAGLRMLLHFQKKSDYKIIIKNVSPEVYETFDVTGFIALFNVKRKMREISVDNCEIIGEGAFGKVYRTDSDTVVKVYNKPEHLPLIENEQKRARQAFIKGIPTAIPFDIAKVGESYGSVFEMLKAQNCNDIVAKEPERLDEIIKKYSEFLKHLHSIEAAPGEFPSAIKIYEKYLNLIRNDIPEKIYVQLKTLLNAMPDDLHIVHGDIQLKNIMLSDDTMVLIDMDTLGAGNPVFDFAGLFMTYLAFNEDEQNNTKKFLGIGKETIDKIYYETLKYYFADSEAETLRKIEDKISVLGYLRFLYVLIVQRNGSDELRDIRIKHSLEHLEELFKVVDDLVL